MNTKEILRTIFPSELVAVTDRPLSSNCSNLLTLKPIPFVLIVFFTANVAKTSSGLAQTRFTRIDAGSIATNLLTSLAPAMGDFDNDGFVDIVCPNAGIYATATAQKIALFHNNRNGTFSRIENAITAEARDWRGCGWADYDNDGNLDFYAVSDAGNGFAAETELFRNNGDNSFKKMSATEVGDIVPKARNPEGPVWADYDRDGFLDIFVSMHDEPDRLFRNLGNDKFVQIVNSTAGLAQDSAKNYGVMWGDFNNDGWPDLYVPVLDDNEIDQRNLFYRNRGDGAFTKIISGSPAADNEHSGSCGWVDYDNDGYLDLFVVNGFAIRKVNSLYHNNGDGTFTKITKAVAGSIVSDTGMFATSTWGDFDSDGFVDMFLTNFDPAGQANFFYHNNGDGSFTRIVNGGFVNDAGSPSTGCAAGDIDNDGFLDLFVARGGVYGSALNLLYRNNGNTNAWLKIKLVGAVSNRSAIGAKVRIKARIRGASMWQMREINSGSGFGQNPLEAHFGLGDATNVEAVRIEWPSGIVQEFQDVATNQILTITEPPRMFIQNVGGLQKIWIKGGRGMKYLVETSLNLREWSAAPWTITITNLDGTGDTGGSVVNEGRTFFRAIQMSP